MAARCAFVLAARGARIKSRLVCLCRQRISLCGHFMRRLLGPSSKQCALRLRRSKVAGEEKFRTQNKHSNKNNHLRDEQSPRSTLRLNYAQRDRHSKRGSAFNSPQRASEPVDTTSSVSACLLFLLSSSFASIRAPDAAEQTASSRPGRRLAGVHESLVVEAQTASSTSAELP